MDVFLPLPPPRVVSKEDLEELARVLCQHLERTMVADFADFELELLRVMRVLPGPLPRLPLL